MGQLRMKVHLVGRGRGGELTWSPWDAAATRKHICLFLLVLPPDLAKAQCEVGAAGGREKTLYLPLLPDLS